MQLSFEDLTLSQDTTSDPRIHALPDIHGHPKGEHRPYAEERPIPYSARMLFLWFFHACRRGSPRFMMVSDHVNYLTFEDPAAVNLVRRALKLAQAGDLYGAAETAGIEITHAAVVSEGLRRGMRYSIGAEVDNDPRSRPDAQNIVDAMKPDGVIRSVHFLPIAHPEHGEGWLWPFDNPEFASFYESVGVERTWELYIETLVAALDHQPAQILGHFYVPAKFGHWPDDAKLEAYEDRIVEICREREIAIELNSRSFYRDQSEEQHRRYREANARLLKKAKAAGVLVAVGSDAHSPRDQGHAFDIVLEMLDEAEINELAFPIGGRFARVALRASKELLEQRRAVAPVSVGTSISGLGRAELVARGVTLPPENDAAERAEAARSKKRNAAAAAAAADAPEAPPRPVRRVKAPPAEAAELAADPAAGAETAELEAPSAAPLKKPRPRPSTRKKAASETDAAPQAPAEASTQTPEEAAVEPPAAAAATSPEAAASSPAGEDAAEAEAPSSAQKPARTKPLAARRAPKTASAKAAEPAAKTTEAAVKAPVKAPAKAPVKKAPPKIAPARTVVKAKTAARPASAKSAPAPAKAVAATVAKKPATSKKAAPAATARAKAAPKARKPAAKAAKPVTKSAAKPAPKAPAKPAAKVAAKPAKAKPKAKVSSNKATRKRR
jgi:HisJ family histidinol phosphate phosphatase